MSWLLVVKYSYMYQTRQTPAFIYQYQFVSIFVSGPRFAMRTSLWITVCQKSMKINTVLWCVRVFTENGSWMCLFISRIKKKTITLCCVLIKSLVHGTFLCELLVKLWVDLSVSSEPQRVIISFPTHCYKHNKSLQKTSQITCLNFVVNLSHSFLHSFFFLW